MKVFLIDNNKIIKYILPSKIDDSFLITYNDPEVKDCLISFEGANNKWYLKSNGNVNIIEKGEEVDNIEVIEYRKYILKVVGKKNYLELFFLPSKETLFKLSFSGLDSFSVGADPSCQIYYNSADLAKVEAIFKVIDGNWTISCINDDNYKVFVNNFRINVKKLKSGDVIFIGGLKIVWMKEFICVNNPRNSLKITGMKLISDDNTSNGEILPVSEDDKMVELYNKDDYFVHYPSIRETLEEKEVVVDAPPNEEKDNSMPFILSMGTSIIMMSSSFMMTYNVFYGFSQGRTIWNVLPQLVMGVSMLIGGLIMPRITRAWQKKQKKKREALRQEKYSKYLADKDRELQLIIKNELQILNDNYLNADACLVALDKKNKNFWWREIEDDAFLAIRVGNGRIDSKVEVKAPEEHFTLDEDNLLEESYKIKDKYDHVDGAPVVVSLKASDVTSLITEVNNKDSYINELVLQLIILHSSLDLKLVLMTKEENMSRWEFMKYLPHIFSEDKSIRFFGTNEKEWKNISNFLEEELKRRKEVAGDNSDKGYVGIPYYLIITDDYKNTKSIQIIDDLVNKFGGMYSFSLLILEDNIKNVPSNSKTFIEVRGKDGVVIEKSTGLNKQSIFYLDKINNDIDMNSIAKRLADIPVMSKEGASVLPTSLKFLDMFGVSKIEQLNILNRWQTNNPVVSLDTVIGVHPNGDKFTLDLHEKFQGPHGLIAGSTGSGKSEFIITYILSMAINYHPYEVQFVLIDYKGGGLAGAFENKETGIKIPHLAGTITNLDTHEMNRSLVSIQSELTRRQKIFSEVREALGEGTIDIYKYQKLYREGVVKTPLSHLFIICDEFAELKQQQPEFMQQLISTSRIGRSLGIHLILATQKPSGVVNDQIWANSRFKVCLRVQEKSDSMEMLKRPEAASIKETGRFYLQVGYDELFEIGQSGWSGAKYTPSDKIQKKIDESINYIDNTGYVIKSIKDIDPNEVNVKDYGDELTNVVKYIYDLGNKEQIETTKLWLDSIPEVIYISNLKKKYNYTPESFYINPVIGEYDDPINQEQGLLNVDLSRVGNLVVYGVPGSGKENLLTNIIRSSIVEHTPDEVNIYILDCGSESLKIFANFPHVGDVLTVDSEDKIKDLISMVSSEIERRKELFVDYAGSYNDYIKNSGSKLPLMLIVINNYDVFVETYQNESDQLQPLFRDGYKYGVVFVVSCNSINAIKTRSIGYFNNKICLHLNDPMDYRSVLSSPRDLIPAEYFGRGLAPVNGRILEFQSALFAPRKDYTNSLRELANTLNNAYTTKASKVPTLPDIVDVNTLLDKVESKTLIPIGYNISNKGINYYNFKINNIIPIVFSQTDNIKLSFVKSLTKIIAKIATINVLDLANVFKEDIDNCNIFNKNNYGDFIKKLKEEILDDTYYLLIGLANMSSLLDKDSYNELLSLLNNQSSNTLKHIIIASSTDVIKSVKIESWYKNNVNEKYYIWLGDDIANQYVLAVPNIPYEEKKIIFDYMGLAIYKGKYEMIKYVVDVRDIDEQ